MPKKSLWRASNKLQLVHADICGPINAISSSNKRYILSFIDDYSRKIWLYFLNEKSEIFSFFKRYKVLVEKEAGVSIGSLRTDKGGEFTSNVFGEFCKSHGIRRKLTVPYTPQQNGVVERKNKMIMNIVHSMLIEKQVLKIFWAEAAKWCVHILNRSPTIVVQNKTPEEAWSGVKPTADHFRVFGCLAHVHVPDQHRVKLDDKSKKCVLLGVSDESKAYRSFDPINDKVLISKDVIFEEQKGWNWKQNTEEHQQDILKWEDNKEYVSDSKEHFEENVVESIDAQETEDRNEDVENSFASIDTYCSDSHIINYETLYEGRVRRSRTKPVWMKDYERGEGLSYDNGLNVMMAIEDDPISFEEVVKSEKWRNAMMKEMESIEKNVTWELTNMLKGVNPIGVKWIFKTKFKETGAIDKFKARLVAKGYVQQYGVDYTRCLDLTQFA